MSSPSVPSVTLLGLITKLAAPYTKQKEGKEVIIITVPQRVFIYIQNIICNCKNIVSVQYIVIAKHMKVSSSSVYISQMCFC